MSTANDLIKSALRLIQVMSPGESLGGSDAADALVVLNNLLDSWRLDRNLVYSIDRTVFTGIVAGTAQYSIATGGTIAIERPIKIEAASWLDNTDSSNPLEIPIHVAQSYEEYQDIAIKSVSTTHTWILYYEPEVTTGQIFLYPKPSDATYDLVLYTWNVLGQLSTGATTVTFPPGYERMIRYGLAVELAPEYGKMASPQIFATLEEARNAIERINAPPAHTEFEAAVGGRSRIWDYRTGSHSKR